MSTVDLRSKSDGSVSEVERDIQRLLRDWKNGDRCMAALDLYYAMTGLEIAHGTKGTIVGITRAGVLLVAWDGETETTLGGIATSPTAVDPIPS